MIHLNQLGEDACPFGDHSSNFDEGIKMHLSQVSQLVFDWKILDSHENLFCGVLIVRIHLGYELFCHVVENGQHKGGLLS